MKFPRSEAAARILSEFFGWWNEGKKFWEIAIRKG